MIESDVEIYTRDGWKNCLALSLQDKVLTVNSDFKGSWRNPTKLAKKKFKGETVNLKNEFDLNLLVTPVHRIVYVDQSLEFMTAHDYYNRFDMTLELLTCNLGKVLSDDHPTIHRCIFSNKSRKVDYAGVFFEMEIPNDTFYVKKEGYAIWLGSS